MIIAPIFAYLLGKDHLFGRRKKLDQKGNDDVIEIARSLGYNCSYTIKKTGYKVNGVIKECLPSYALTIFTRDIIANLPRKQKKEKVITNQYSIKRALG